MAKISHLLSLITEIYKKFEFIWIDLLVKETIIEARFEKQ